MATRQVAYSVIPRFREQWDLSQQDLAVQLGVSVSTITRWEAAGHAPLWFARWTRGFELDRTTGDTSLSTLDNIAVPSSRELIVCPKCSDRRVSPLEDSKGFPSRTHVGCARCGHCWEVANKHTPFPFNLKPYGG